MRMTANGLLFLFVSFSCVVGVYSNEVDTTCYDNGFEDGLMCSTCIKLEQFTKDSGIVDLCNKCCQEETEEIKKAQKVVLTLGKMNERSFPHVTEFIQNHAEQFPQFSYQYTQFANPRMKLLDSRDKLIDVVRIDHWKTEDIVEFLSKTLDSN
uniref:Selenoprotein F n=1 Tax=Vannella robusta TaxID=1487602 RepID=A0A7S4IVJ6_9EUKA